jgi:hypothetical protein
VSATDLERLRVAKRAYDATRPSEVEVQAGVRRARLWLGRPRPRRRWFSKGLVFAVLALGGLAYAKPHAIGELVAQVTKPPKAPALLGKHAAYPLPPVEAPASDPAAAPPVLPAPVAPPPPLEVTLREVAPSNPSPELLRAKAPRRVTAPSAVSEPLEPAPLPSASSEPSGAAAEMSAWGRVGQALAQGDDTEALSALQQLSRSGDERTRDKADLGRAQLFMAHGQTEKACALARSLTQRRAGSRIERQAQVLLKSCAR